MSEGRREGLPPPKPMGRFVSSWIGDDRLAVAPLARPDVVSADGGPLKKRRQPPLLGAGSPEAFWHTGTADRRGTAGHEGFICMRCERSGLTVFRAVFESTVLD